MPKYYTPKRPQIRFANSGSAMHTLGVQRVENLLQTTSDKATLDKNFSGVPRFPRHANIKIQEFTTEFALSQTLTFDMGPARTEQSQAKVPRYSWRPGTPYLQAQSLRVYDMSGSVEVIVTNDSGSHIDVLSVFSRSFSGGVDFDIYGRSTQFAPEVVQWNAYYSGSEPFERNSVIVTSEELLGPEHADANIRDEVILTGRKVNLPGTDVFSSIDPQWVIEYYYTQGGVPTASLISVPTSMVRRFYAKTAANGFSSLTRFDTWKFVPSILNVFNKVGSIITNNIPPNAPSGSEYLAPSLVNPPTPGQKSQPFKAFLGIVNDPKDANSVLTASIWANQGSYAWIFGSTENSGTIISACSGNIIYAGSVTASIDSASFDSNTGRLLIHVLASSSDFPQSGQYPIYIHSWQSLQSSVSGVYFNSTIYNPVKIPLQVTAPGRLRDLRAWVEFVHDFRDFNLYSDTAIYPDWGLQGVQIALRSPNTSFHSAHPLWNNHSGNPLRVPETPLTGVANRFGNFYYHVPELLRNSYLLWAGHGCEDGLTDVLNDTLQSSTLNDSYHEFDRDLDMRTVFWDGSPVKNPRDLQDLYPAATPFYLGDEGSKKSWNHFREIESYRLVRNDTYPYQSPTKNAMYSGMTVPLDPAQNGLAPLTGACIPWMTDTRLNLGGLEARRNSGDMGLISQIPPGGWLSARGGMLPWLTVREGRQQNLDGFQYGRIFIKSDTSEIFFLGGYGSNSSIRSTTFQLNILFGSLEVNPVVTKLVSTLPTAYDQRFSVNYYEIEGAAENRGRIIVIGGSDGNQCSQQVWVGEWTGQSAPSAEISWTSSVSLPTQICDHTAYIRGNHIFVSPGLNAPIDAGPSTRVNACFSAEIDQTTGLITGNWQVHNFPDSTTIDIRNIMALGGMQTYYGGGVSTKAFSSDGGTNFSFSQPSELIDNGLITGVTKDSSGENPSKFTACTTLGRVLKTSDANSWSVEDWSNSPPYEVSFNTVLEDAVDNIIAAGSVIRSSRFPSSVVPVGVKTDYSALQKTTYSTQDLNLTYGSNQAFTGIAGVQGGWYSIRNVPKGAAVTYELNLTNDGINPPPTQDRGRTMGVEVWFTAPGLTPDIIGSNAAKAKIDTWYVKNGDAMLAMARQVNVPSLNTTILGTSDVVDVHMRININAGILISWQGTLSVGLTDGKIMILHPSGEVKKLLKTQQGTIIGAGRAAVGKTLYRSINNGLNWTSSSLPGKDVQAGFLGGPTGLSIPWAFHVVKSTAQDRPYSYNSVAQNSITGKIIAVGNQGMSHQSTNDGVTWTRLPYALNDDSLATVFSTPTSFNRMGETVLMGMNQLDINNQEVIMSPLRSKYDLEGDSLLDMPHDQYNQCFESSNTEQVWVNPDTGKVRILFPGAGGQLWASYCGVSTPGSLTVWSMIPINF